MDKIGEIVQKHVDMSIERQKHYEEGYKKGYEQALEDLEPSEEDKAKVWGQFKLQLNGVFEPFDVYGLGELIIGAKEEVTELGIQAYKRLTGYDVPICLDEARKKNAERWSK